jgi:4-hydroxy 2-oxovalerate aldolase
MKIMDCTLRDGANVIRNGFPGELTEVILDGLTKNGIPAIEFGNAKGIGAYEVSGAVAPLTDEEYLELAHPFLERA